MQRNPLSSYRGVTYRQTAGVVSFRDPTLGSRVSFGSRAGGLRAAKAYIDQMLSQTRMASNPFDRREAKALEWALALEREAEAAGNNALAVWLRKHHDWVKKQATALLIEAEWPPEAPGSFAPEPEAEAGPEVGQEPTEYFYGLRNRPPGPGAVPSGYLRVLPKVPEYPALTRYGLIVYPQALSKDAEYSYELTRMRSADEALSLLRAEWIPWMMDPARISGARKLADKEPLKLRTFALRFLEKQDMLLLDAPMDDVLDQTVSSLLDALALKDVAPEPAPPAPPAPVPTAPAPPDPLPSDEWSEATPGGMAVLRHPTRGAIVDAPRDPRTGRRAAGTWFVVFEREGQDLIEYIASRQEAFRVWARVVGAAEQKPAQPAPVPAVQGPPMETPLKWTRMSEISRLSTLSPVGNQLGWMPTPSWIYVAEYHPSNAIKGRAAGGPGRVKYLDPLWKLLVFTVNARGSMCDHGTYIGDFDSKEDALKKAREDWMDPHLRVPRYGAVHPGSTGQKPAQPAPVPAVAQPPEETAHPVDPQAYRGGNIHTLPLYGSHSAETAYVQEDYPYGYRLRTQRRAWVEYKPNFGYRMVTQTLNPKNGRWNKPKAGQYLDVVGLLFLDTANNHVEMNGVTRYTSVGEVANFVSLFPDMPPRERKTLKEWAKAKQVMYEKHPHYADETQAALWGDIYDVLVSHEAAEAKRLNQSKSNPNRRRFL